MESIARLRIWRIALSAFLLLVVLAYAMWQPRLDNIADSLASVSLELTAASGLILVISQLLAAIRLRCVTADFGFQIGYRSSLIAVVLGGVAGIIAFQILGQIAARAIILKRNGLPAQAVAAITLYERTTAVFISVVFAVCGGIYIFGTISLDFETGGRQLLTTVFSLLATVAVVSIFGWRELLARFVLPLISWRKLGHLLYAGLLTSLVQICTLIALVIIISQFASGINIFKLTGASAVVMFAAALPISFGGWGVRELSAVAAFSVIGIPPQISVTASVLFGLLSLGVVACMSVWAAASTPRESGRLQATDQTISQPRAMRQRRAIEFALGLIAAVLIMFQIQVPLERGWVNFSPADLPAVIIGMIVLLRLRPTDRNRFILILAAAGTVAMIGSYIHGYLIFGKSDWAGARVLGWFVLLSYGAVGAILAGARDIDGQKHLAVTLGIAGSTIVVISFVLAGITDAPKRLEGFSGNPNALAFQLLVCLSVVISCLRQLKFWLPLTFVLAGGVILTGSLVGIMVLPILAAAGFILIRRQTGRPILKYVLLLLGLMVGGSLIIDALYFFADVNIFEGLFNSIRSRGEIGASFIERAETLIKGIQIFLAHPYLGAGLGYFYEHNLGARGPLVIHSTPVWILAEFGGLGLALLAAFLLYFLRYTFRSLTSNSTVLLALVTITFVIFGLVHDIFYQRIWWVAIGASLVMIRDQAPRKSPSWRDDVARKS